MSLSQGLSRGRSHIIFIIALLAASAYILWVEGRSGPITSETARGRIGTIRTTSAPWRVELGAFRTAEAAGRHWDQLGVGLETLQPLELVLVKEDGLIRLQAGPIEDEARAKALCDQVEAAGGGCAVAPPVRPNAS